MSQQRETANCLPGFGLPLNYNPTKESKGFLGNLFPTALGFELCGFSLPLTTLRELSMMHFMNAITDKPDWHIKVHDDIIIEKWRAEVSAAGQDFTDKMFGYCVQELRHKASFVPAPPAVPPAIIVYDGNVVKSDYAVTAEVKREIQDAMQKFEDDIPLRLRDWHPFSDEQVLDLVHPSLFPLVYGTTRVLEHGTTTLEDFVQRCGQGKVASIPSEQETEESGNTHYSYKWRNPRQVKAYSRKFQWLPCEVDIAGEGVRITSYINNLHPDEKDIYRLVEKIIDASIPLWDLTLSPLQAQHPRFPPRRVLFEGCEYDPDPENGPETEGPQQLPDEDEEEFWDRRQEWIEATRQVVRPEPGDFRPRETPSLNIREKYGRTGLQIIIKFANIVLTPEKPSYGGGSWHVEGQLRPLYYYSSENITPSSLNFLIFGCENEEPGVQEIGGVDTREGRLLTFPNNLQHRVGAFKLADPTKPGHRKILALFLVDPNIKIISTAHVPCQRKDWWKEVALRQESLSENITGLGQLPVELQNHIFDEVEGFPLGMDEAKALRLELMEERKAYVQVQDATFQQNTFSLCEH
ncbi:hypothetical protein CVT24_010932 [Panaeolus cyanescens]|uniref:Uncharacterized protein n=1 Tax=Panaeolus cyanescens TaxID=181874 RepID=A0A409WDF8_9AGAR|nr:hypothetical protein CVT24_010932 [Panaeolus cyanescens]